MATWRAERWKAHPYQGEELVAYVSGTSEDYANEAAIRYVEALQAQGFEIALAGAEEVKLSKGTETFVVRVRRLEK